jgi:N-ethylmaleimide reductase
MKLLTPLQAGALHLSNRVLMAPLTRCRADADHNPTPLMAEYYAQRSSAGLIIAEATMVQEGNSAFWMEPGIYSDAQVRGWQRVTEAVHDRGGRIVLQLWHGGRACHPLLNGGAQPVAPSPLAIAGEEVHTPAGKQPCVVPRELRDDEIPGIVAAFGRAAANARAAGFDGVEIHGANGYLLDSFLRDGSNRRAGPYGGPLENRARLMFEVVDAVADVWGADRVGLRISPLNSYNDMRDSDPVALTTHVARAAAARGLAYLHVMRSDLYGVQQADVLTPARAHFPGALVGNVAYTSEEAERDIAAGRIDAVAFGVPFLANPDLPVRIAAGAPLNEPRPETFYTPGAAGYTDYPELTAA